MKKSRPLTLYILFAMILGIIVGYACNKAFPDKQTAATISGYISLVTDLFLAIDQDDHRPSGVFDAGGRDRAYG